MTAGRTARVPAGTSDSGAALHVLRAGPSCLVTDLGRPGLAGIGVGPSGAADRAALLAGALAVGNDRHAAALELVLTGFRALAVGALTVAVTGADTELVVAGAPVPGGTAVRVPDGAELGVRMPARGSTAGGLRSYLSVRGGIAVPPVLGSRSTDTLSGIGPAPVRTGDRLPIGDQIGEFGDQVSLLGTPATAPNPLQLTVFRGPRDDWFADPSELVRSRWTISPRSDRIGVRLVPTGDSGWLIRAAGCDRELASEPMLRGAIQVPPNGEPVVLFADHPVTGGYPVIGVVADSDVDAFAQLRPGEQVGFRWADERPPAT